MNAHRETAYKGFSKAELPISEDLQDNSILLPLYVPMCEDDVNHVVKTVHQVLSLKPSPISTPVV